MQTQSSNPKLIGQKLSLYESFSDRYRFLSSSHDGNYDASMWDYKPVPYIRMLTRRHPRRLLPNDLIPFAGTKQALPQVSPERAYWIAFFTLAAWWYWNCYEWGDSVLHFGDHKDVATSYQESVEIADLAENEEFYHPRVWQRTSMQYQDWYTHLYHRELKSKLFRGYDETAMVGLTRMGVPVQTGAGNMITSRWGPLLPDRQ